jgi:hypothetical protein
LLLAQALKSLGPGPLVDYLEDQLINFAGYKKVFQAVIYKSKKSSCVEALLLAAAPNLFLLLSILPAAHQWVTLDFLPVLNMDNKCLQVFKPKHFLDN